MSDKKEHIQADLSQPKTLLDYLRLYFTGFAMGSADIVPGVSGGTMAFILGVYETLINAIKSVDTNVIKMALRFDIKGIIDHIPFRFLIALGLGILSAVLLLASLLHDLLENQPTFIFAFFAGLILASILAIGYKVKWDVRAMVGLVIAALFAFFLVGIEGQLAPVEAVVQAVHDEADVTEPRARLIAELQAENYPNAEATVDELITLVQTDDDYSALEDELAETIYEPSSPLVLFFSGMIAICAMILPGISGSFILLILGQYAVVLGAVKTLDLISIGAVGLGAVIGIIAFSRILSWLLKHHENLTIAALVGFMLGSLRLIWTEAVKGVEVINDTGALNTSQWVTVVVVLVGGFLLVSFLDHLQSRMNPVFAWAWKPGKPIDTITEKADALD
ncbi:MAG: hypothetical protein CUN56_06445 [Phototrophicales bacterium]|nr:MAG: hypothetical protein CUN56_06445 [Phototrophicales bacterium]RMG75281.1 MAG: DUF368 domain-containing protein [Chloroflexota bacterium]